MKEIELDWSGLNLFSLLNPCIHAKKIRVRDNQPSIIFHSIFIDLIQDFKKFYIYSMYVILVYDIGEKRVSKMLKLCRQYLNWIQNSVFEGEITEVKLKELKIRAKEIMKPEYDSLIIFKSRNEKWLEKEIVGKEKSNVDTFL